MSMPDKYSVTVHCKTCGKSVVKQKRTLDRWAGRCNECRLKVAKTGIYLLSDTIDKSIRKQDERGEK